MTEPNGIATSNGGGEPNGAHAPDAPARSGRAYDPAVLARAQKLVETTSLSQVEIGARIGVPPTTISLWKLREGWVRPPGAPLAPSFVRVEGARPDSPEGRQARRAKRMVDRLYKVFGRGVAALETRLGAGEEGLEKDARALASLAKTLETLIALDRDDGARPKDPDDVDPDDIRARLARRLYALGQGGE
jgi:hypothetical protein